MLACSPPSESHGVTSWQLDWKYALAHAPFCPALASRGSSATTSLASTCTMSRPAPCLQLNVELAPGYFEIVWCHALPSLLQKAILFRLTVLTEAAVFLQSAKA